MKMIVKGGPNVPKARGLMLFSNSSQMVCQQKVRNSEYRVSHFWQKVLNSLNCRIH